MKRALLIAAALVGTASPALAQPGTYRALGTEPFWSVEIRNGRMVYEDAAGERIAVRTPRTERIAGGRRYRSQRLTMRVFAGRECSDGMSDRLFADSVEVRVDGRRIEGCGGAILPPRTLADTGWAIVSINGQAVPAGERYRIAFQADRLSGAAGCNRFSGSYRVGRDGFQAGPLTMTRMACPGPAMAHERAVADILRGRVRLSYPDGSTLVMRGVAGGEIRLRRLLP